MRYTTITLLAIGLLTGNALTAPAPQAGGAVNAFGGGGQNGGNNQGNQNAQGNQGNQGDQNNNNDNGGQGGDANVAAEFVGLACTDGTGAGSCQTDGQCDVNGNVAVVEGQCGQ
ncbi:hypothetical protein LZ30DRAFT_752356 [Colletotrichum cereale]|nr:hypothetical protein LZ30DRAFT_752356 [Colletotrichum cereale]